MAAVQIINPIVIDKSLEDFMLIDFSEYFDEQILIY